MKRTFKFTLVALAAIGLASCSSDDLFGSADNGKLNKNALEVTVEDAIDGVTMRTAYTPDADANKATANLFWQKDDEIRVYDETMIKYDKYTYDPSAGAFALSGKTTANLKEVKYAFFTDKYTADKNNLQTGWDYETNSVYVKATIPQEGYTLEEDKEIADGEVAYKSLLPLWGTAKQENGKVGVDLKYLTAILRIDLSNVKGNVSKVTVKGWEDAEAKIPARMNGDFIAYLTKNGVEDANAYLISENEEAAVDDTDNVIEVDLSNVTTNKTMVLVPLIVQRYGKLEVKISKTAGGEETLKTSYGFTPARRTFYKAGDAKYDFQGEKVSDINAALIEFATEKSDVTISAASESTANDKDLDIPTMAAGTVTINLKKLVKYNTGNEDKKVLNVTANSYAGNLILHVDDVEDIDNINVMAPNATVVLSGRHLNDVTMGATVGMTAKSLTIAAPEPNEDETKQKKDPETNLGNITLKSDFTGDLILGEHTIVKGLTLPASDNKVKSIALNGELTGDVALGEEDTTTLSVGGNAKLTGTITTYQDKLTIAGKADVATVNCVALEVKDAAVVNEANVSGDATVALTTEGEAIKAALNMTSEKDGAKLTLTGGYIAKLISTHKITILNTEAIQTAIKEATVELSAAYTSTWCGKAISLKKLDETGKETPDATDFADYNQATDIWTATQLASIAATSDVTLKSNIDLGKKAWTPVKLDVNFNGGEKKISNLSVDVEGDNVGLFSTVGDNKKIEKLTIENAVVKSSEKMDEDGEDVEEQGDNVGILVGKAEGALTLENVSVTGTSSVEASYEKAENVGGLVGYAESNFSATNAPVKITKIKGQYNLGGIVGYANGTAGIEDAKTIADVIAFEVHTANTNPQVNGKVEDAKAGTVGMYFGYANGNVTLAKDNTKDVIKGNRVKLGFKGDFHTDQSTGKWYAYYGDKKANVGKMSESATYTVDGSTRNKATNKYDTVAEVPEYVHDAYVVLNCEDYE